MKNGITVAASTLRAGRRIAAELSTWLNVMIRECLERLTGSQARGARLRIADLCRNSGAEVGDTKWTREDLHER